METTYYLKKAIDQDGTDTGDLLKLRDQIKEWSEYCDHR